MDLFALDLSVLFLTASCANNVKKLYEAFDRNTKHQMQSFSMFLMILQTFQINALKASLRLFKTLNHKQKHSNIYMKFFV
ncbi:CLUMA_CG013747, isoform A [Clunio marinus]|uniref:CLUMA_CG013747, isoform A n=1 Tax=Clunio marinus TaxID=568069 RepID=A0A1J1IN18_9DIPT|nr:CLUMA_CG013747, isoform A [Clunio marinus]